MALLAPLSVGSCSELRPIGRIDTGGHGREVAGLHYKSIKRKTDLFTKEKTQSKNKMC